MEAVFLKDPRKKEKKKYFWPTEVDGQDKVAIFFFFF